MNTQKVEIPADVEREYEVFSGVTWKNFFIILVPALILAWFNLKMLKTFGTHVGGATLSCSLVVVLGICTWRLGKKDGLPVSRYVRGVFHAERAKRGKKTHFKLVDEKTRQTLKGLKGYKDKDHKTVTVATPMTGLSPSGHITLSNKHVAQQIHTPGFDLHIRSEDEQEAILEGVEGLLDAAQSKFQVCVTTEPVNFDEEIERLYDHQYPTPGLRRAAIEEAQVLDGWNGMLRKQVCVVVTGNSASEVDGAINVMVENMETLGLSPHVATGVETSETIARVAGGPALTEETAFPTEIVRRQR